METKNYLEAIHLVGKRAFRTSALLAALAMHSVVFVRKDVCSERSSVWQ
jgi:hypothetical protein